VEEDLQPPALHAHQRQSLDAVRRLDVRNALGQEERGPDLGAGCCARRVARWVDAEPVQRQSGVGRQDFAELWHNDRLDGHCFARAVGRCRHRGSEGAHGQGACSQRAGTRHESGSRPSGDRRSVPRAYACSAQSHVLRSFHPASGSTAGKDRKIGRGASQADSTSDEVGRVREFGGNSQTGSRPPRTRPDDTQTDSLQQTESMKRLCAYLTSYPMRVAESGLTAAGCRAVPRPRRRRRRRPCRCQAGTARSPRPRSRPASTAARSARGRS
jgi:hypothetical protein